MVAIPTFFTRLRRVPSHTIQVVGWRFSPLEVMAVIPTFLYWFRKGSVQNYPKEWGGPPLKSIEVVVVLNFLCWFIKGLHPTPS